MPSPKVIAVPGSGDTQGRTPSQRRMGLEAMWGGICKSGTGRRGERKAAIGI